MELRMKLGHKARVKEANLGFGVPHVQKNFPRKNET
jgi:hypothetical protein